MGKFITNKGSDTLQTLVQNYATHSSALDFLVGYFYFTGFCEIAEAIADTPMRILIGMEAEADANNFIHEYTTIGDNSKGPSRDDVRNAYLEKLRVLINGADALDNEAFYRSFDLFTHKLEAGTLEVRKTAEPNHAKMYLFYIDHDTTSGQDEPKVIIGSSNFSIQGFKKRNEVNVNLQDPGDYKEGKAIFDELWRTSVPLVSATNKDAFIQKVLKRTWVMAHPSPYLVYVRVLYEYFYVSDGVIKTPWQLTRGSSNEYADISYQTDAIREGVETLRRHSGVIVADVVGLGKSIIAACIAANVNRRVAVVCPPHLKAQWDDYILSFRLNGKAYSSGKMEDALKDWQGAEPITVIVDEAHRYKNEDTENYALLHKLCAANYVILLSATPFNNKPQDVFSLLKLFQIPMSSTIQTVDNVGKKMKELSAQYNALQQAKRNKKCKAEEEAEAKKRIAREMRMVLDPVVIRRTRVDLTKIVKYNEDLKSQGIKFSTINAPETKTYDLGDLADLYMNTLNRLKGTEGEDGKETSGFIGARYKPLTYLKRLSNGKIDPRLVQKYSKRFNVENFETGQRNMADFMRQLLVRRFESAKHSFMQTLNSISHSMKLTREYFDTYKLIPVDKRHRYPDMDELEADMGDDSEAIINDMKEALAQKGIWTIDAEDISFDFLTDLDSDIKLIDTLIMDWLKIKSDPKRESMVRMMKDAVANDPKRKIIVFSEFADTVDDLTEALKAAGLRVMSYTSKKASKTLQSQVRANFDAGMRAAEQKNDADVLVATDAISEGFSLHRAGTIYNYDIPYNPTRVIQRVGRIDRINKKMFDRLFIYNFFPSEIGEKVSHTREISTLKIALFQAIFGSDTKILTDEEVIAGYMEGKDAAEDSWDAEYRNELYRIEREDKETLRQAIALPHRCRIGRKGGFDTVATLTTQPPVGYNDGNTPVIARAKPEATSSLFDGMDNKGVILFSRRADAARFSFADPTGDARPMEAEEALGIFRASKDEAAHKVTEAFYPLYERAKSTSTVKSGALEMMPSLQKAMQELRDLKGRLQQDEEDDRYQYVLNLLNLLEKDALPEYCIKSIAAVCKSHCKDADDEAASLMQEISPSYVSALVNKDRMIGHEPQTVLVAEELR